ncbi:MAG: CUB domain-containing protein, partial [Bacteroidota bacterium]
MANGSISTCSGNFYDPQGAAVNYLNNSNFTETFCSDIVGQCVTVSFTAFNLEAGFDFLYIYDGASSTQNLIGVFSGTTLPGTITSSGGCLTFVFTSDATNRRPGWEATISCGPCNINPDYEMSGTPIVACSGTFYDPGGTGDYPTGVTYTQTICSGTAGQCVSLFFSQFDIENGYDFLSIYDGPTTAGTLIGTYTGTLSPGSVTATSGCLTLVFTSDIIVGYPGWTASISCGTCGVVNTNCGCPVGGTPPINDNCSGAINIGTLPTPAPCPNGAGNTITIQGTTNCATAPANFAYQTGCQPAGNQPWPAADVWYQMTVTGTELHINIPGGGMQTPSVAIYQGSNCNNLIPRGCAIGNAAGLNTTFAPVAPGTYWIQVSGGNLNDQCDFSMTVWNNLDCQGCVLGSNLVVNPPPVNGYYQPNTVVNFCFTVTNYNQTSFNWLHGVVPTFGSGWNLGSLTVTPAANCGADDAGLFWNNQPGVWSWYNSVTSTATGATYGPGFFFEQSQPIGFVDGNPGNSYGDNGYLTNLSTSGSCTWTFCWTITTQPNCTNGADLNVDINTLGDGESGGWASIGCQGDP